VQGLGYNRRALSLHRAACVVAEHGWPDDLTELPGVGPYTAAAVGNFAFGRDVLPIDVNVRRIQERTGELFDGSCTQALFDLGATICLARNPALRRLRSRRTARPRGQRYEPLRKQSKFEGFVPPAPCERTCAQSRPVSSRGRRRARLVSSATASFVLREGSASLPS